MLYTTRALVLHYLRYKESSIIVRCYTEAFGAQSYLVNGARSTKGASKIAYYQPLTLLDMVVYHKPNKDLHHVSQVQLHDASLLPSADMRKSSIRMFLAEVFSRVLQEQEPNPEKFAFLFTSVLAFEHADVHTENFHLQCLLGLAKRLGFGVHTASELYHQVYALQDRSGTAAGLAQPDNLASLQALLDQPYFTAISMPNHVRRSLLDAIMRYYHMHIDGMPALKSLDVLHTLFV